MTEWEMLIEKFDDARSAKIQLCKIYNTAPFNTASHAVANPEIQRNTTPSKHSMATPNAHPASRASTTCGLGWRRAWRALGVTKVLARGALARSCRCVGGEFEC